MQRACQIKVKRFRTTSRILLSQDHETAAISVPQTSPVGGKNCVLFKQICIAAGHVCEKALLIERLNAILTAN